MVATGIQELAESFADLAQFCSSETGLPALWILDCRGRCLASSFEQSGPGPGFRFEGAQLAIEGLDDSLRAWIRQVEWIGTEAIWVVLIDSIDRQPFEMEQLGDALSMALEADGQREIETEDTTEHLLSLFEQIRAMHDLADRLPSCDTIEKKAELCLSSLGLAVPSRISMILIHREGEQDHLAYSMDDDGETASTMEFRLPEQSGDPVSEVIASGNLTYGTVLDRGMPDASLVAQARKDYLVVPIRFGEESQQEVFGAILLMDRLGEHSDQSFGNPEAELVSSVGVLLGLLLGTEKRIHAEKEMKLASTIQETLVPEQAPSWPGMVLASRNICAGQVGGDYLDYLESPDGTKHVIIADVSGHNMASAMAMVMGRTQFKSTLAHISSPAEVMDDVANGLFADLQRNELFITTFLLSLRSELPGGGYRSSFTNAGHNPPLLFRATGEIEDLEGGGPMVGFLRGLEYEEFELDLFPGDLVVLYTDGVTEAENDMGEMFELEGLMEVVALNMDQHADVILDSVFEGVARHAGPNADADDITVIILQVTKRNSETEQLQS